MNISHPNPPWPPKAKLKHLSVTLKITVLKLRSWYHANAYRPLPCQCIAPVAIPIMSKATHSTLSWYRINYSKLEKHEDVGGLAGILFD